MATADARRNPYLFIAAPFPPTRFEVREVAGREAISKTWAFDVSVVSRAFPGEDLEQIAVGHRASLVIRAGGAPRVVAGVVERVRSNGLEKNGEVAHTTFRIVPALRLLHYKRGSRIFQDKRVPDVVDEVLRAAGVGAAFRLAHEYPVRAYITQYEESDLAFVERLLAEAGMFYAFADVAPGGLDDLDRVITDVSGVLSGDVGAAVDLASMFAPPIALPAETVVIADDAPAYPTCAVPRLSYLHAEGLGIARHDKVTKLVSTTRVRSDVAEHREYDPARPKTILASRAGGAGPLDVVQALAASVSPEALSAIADQLPTPSNLETYEHHGHFLFPDPPEVAEIAGRIRRHRVRRRATATGESGCPHLRAGHRFALEDHLVVQLNRDHVVVAVQHRGHVMRGGHEVYACSFETVPASTPYPPRAPRRRSVQPFLTATVVGPPGEDVYVDLQGRVKVHFHWDRRGPSADTTCWIRSLQPWAGAGFGHQFIPRVGMEVGVTFEGGDPDRPVVIGSLYNATHPVPFPLPVKKTQSGIRTQSTPTGGGFNELMFDDEAGAERIYVHAERDFDVVVERDHHEHVLGSRDDTVDHDAIERVLRNHESRVEGNRVDVVEGSAERRVGGALVTRVDGRARHEGRGQADQAYLDDLTIKVGGSFTTVVGEHDDKRAWVTHANGVASLSSLEKLELRSDAEIVIAVGKSSVRVTPDGIEITSDAIKVKGGDGSLSASDDGLALSSKGDAQLVVEKKLVIKTSGASIALDKEVKIDGSKILMNSPEQASDPPPKEPDPPTTLDLTDADAGTPLAQRRFIIELDAGGSVTGHTDDDGKATLELPSDGTITFSDVKMADDTSTDRMQPHVVRPGELLARLAFAGGFDADEAWKDPKNDDLRQKRKSPDQLQPGDVLHLPVVKRQGLDVKKGTSNSYKAKVPKTNVRVVFTDVEGEPRRDDAYVVQGLPAPLEGATDGEGVATFDVPVHVSVVSVLFKSDGRRFVLRLGGMDPVDEPSGARKRLQNLGYRTRASGSGRGAQEEADREAIRQFQTDQGLPVTGDMDAATENALTKAHGS